MRFRLTTVIFYLILVCTCFWPQTDQVYLFLAAALDSTPNPCIPYIHEHCGATVYEYVYTNTHKSHSCHRGKRLAKRIWLLLYAAAVGCVIPVCAYSVHCSGCRAAAFEIQLPSS